MSQPNGDLWAIVLAGGEGTRLAAMTAAFEGRAIPKQFAAYGTCRTFLQRTMDRVGALVSPSRTVVVVGAAHVALARDQLAGFEGVEIVGQPAGRGTLPGVLLPLAHVRARDPQARVAIFPSDHHIRRARPFREAFLRATEAASHGAGGVVLVGAAAERPATELGWILPGAARAPEMAGACTVARFVEKPNEETARALLSGGALWNTLIVAASARALLALAREHLPEVTARFDRYRPHGGDARRELEDLYADLPSADLSRDVLERARDLGVVEMTGAGWSDCGTPEQLAASLRYMGVSAMPMMGAPLAAVPPPPA